MMANHHFIRMNILELKEIVYERIGPERLVMYFHLLKRFLSSKLSKTDFDKNCIQTIGRENLPLHNKLIRSIIQNASQAKIPPPKARKVELLGVKVANGSSRNYLQSIYGDAFPHSRRCRSTIARNRKFRDGPSPLGPLGKSPCTTCEETASRLQEQQSPAEFQAVSGKLRMGAASVEDGEEVEQVAVIPRWHSIAAPLDVSVNLDRARKAPQSSSSYHSVADTCQSNGELPDTRSLERRLQKKLESEGVGISLDGANLINNSLDVFLKRVISQCLGNSGARRVDPRTIARESNGETVISRSNQLLYGKYADMRMQSTEVSMLDFRVALESNPSVLGENWPTQLEKISNYTFQ